MSIVGLILLTAGMLLLPELFRNRGKTKPEIHGYLKVLEFIYWSYCVIWHRLRIDKRAPLPEHGPAILICNHTCGIDHVLLQADLHIEKRPAHRSLASAARATSTLMSSLPR